MKIIFQYYKITHYFRLFVFVLNIFFEPYNITPYELLHFRFFFSNLKILHITLNIFKNIFHHYKITHYFRLFFYSKYFVWILQYYTLLWNIFPYFKITHYFRLFVFVLNILFEPYDVTPYNLQIVFFQNFLFQPYNITHYRLCVSFYSLLHLNLAFLEILQIKINDYKITLLHCYTFIQLQLTLQKVCKDL